MLSFQNVTEMYNIFEVPLHQPVRATEVDPQKACQLFRENLLDRNSDCPRLLLSLSCLMMKNRTVHLFHSIKGMMLTGQVIQVQAERYKQTA